jgi:hypothetical protein
MKSLLIALLILTLLAACAPTQTPLPDTPVDSSSTPQNSELPVGLTPLPGNPASPKTDDFLPRPGDSGMVSGAVFIDSIELLTLESYPLQFSLALTGNLPTPCHQLRVTVNPPDAEKNIYVEVYSVTAPDAICTTMLQAFTENIPLGSFPGGHYTVWVNGEQVAEFDS